MVYQLTVFKIPATFESSHQQNQLAAARRDSFLVSGNMSHSMIKIFFFNLGTVILRFIIRNMYLVFVSISGTELLKPLESPK